MLPNGSFNMGSPANESERNADEIQHRVTINKKLYFSRFETTAGQFQKFMNDSDYVTDAERHGFGGTRLNPVSGDTDQYAGATWKNPGNEITVDHPVVQVSWNDANAFANWLRKKEGLKYRLPTEAEWEYAARAGTTTRYSSGNQPSSLARFANIYDLSASKVYENSEKNNLPSFDDGYANASPVGRFLPNNFGLYDMHGNVWEWCYDTYDQNFYRTPKTLNPYSDNGSNLKILRGGCYI